MVQLASRGEIVDFYTSLTQDPNLLPAIDALDPDVLRFLLFGGPRNIQVGTEFVRGSQMRWASSGLGELLAELPLDGHCMASATPLRRTYLAQALDELKQLPHDATRLLDEFTSTLVWLAPATTHRDAPILTSASLPAAPHTTFITDKALRHIPPNQVYPQPLPYCLMENLLHEALHQQLSATLLQQEIMALDYDAAKAARVPVPWRGGSWEPDRVLHAVRVYKALARLRKARIDSSTLVLEEQAFLEEAYHCGRDAFHYLRDRLLELRRYFTNVGFSLVKELCLDDVA